MGNEKGWRRLNGEGSVFETTNNGYKGWLAVITGTDEDGGTYRITGWSRNSPQEALRRRQRNLERALSKGKHSAVVRGVRFEDCYDEWLDRPPPRSPNSIRAIESSFKWVWPYFKGRWLNTITEDELKDWLWKKLPADDCPPSSRTNAYTNLKAYLNYCVKKGHISLNPMAAIREDTVRQEPAVNKLDMKFIGKRTNIVKYMLDEIGQDPDHKHREWLPVLVFLALGLRRGELLGLTWDQITNLNDPKRCLITIDRQLYRETGKGYYLRPETKGKKDRHIPCPAIWREMLLEQKAKNLNAKAEGISKDLVFLGSDGQFIKYDKYYAAWRQVLTDYIKKEGTEEDKQLGVDDYFRPHFMRKISVSLAHRIGIPERIVMEIVGHNSEEVHHIYTILSREEKTEAVESLGEALKVVRKKAPGGKE